MYYLCQALKGISIFSKMPGGNYFGPCHFFFFFWLEDTKVKIFGGKGRERVFLETYSRVSSGLPAEKGCGLNSKTLSPGGDPGKGQGQSFDPRGALKAKMCSK